MHCHFDLESSLTLVLWGIILSANSKIGAVKVEIILISLCVVFLIVKLMKKTETKETTQRDELNRSPQSVKNESMSKTYNDALEDDDFISFTIGGKSSVKEASKSSNKTAGQWFGANQMTTVQGVTISKGFVYVGGRLGALNGWDKEPSLIDDSLSCMLNGTSEEFADDSLGYWPTYASLSDKCRAAYLLWLASTRDNPAAPLGYVFIYFYGLERRIVESANKAIEVSDEEFVAIFNEVKRLHGVYGENRSFFHYSSEFLEFMSLLRPTLFRDTVDLPETRLALSFKLKLANRVASNELIDADLGFEWLKNSYHYSFKMPARRCEDEFRRLFKMRFKEKFGDGFVVKPNKSKLSLSYHPASGGISPFDFSNSELPDPSELKAPINKLAPIADECTEALNKYSRYLAKSGTSRNDMAAALLLPRELLQEQNSEAITTLVAWVNDVIGNDGGITTVHELWKHTEMPLPKAFNKKENETLVSLVNHVGFNIAPDQRLNHAKASLDDKVVIYPLENAAHFHPSERYHTVSLALRLGSMVASIDGNVDASERVTLESLIDDDTGLNRDEKVSLHAYLTWRLISKVNMVGLKARISSLQPSEVNGVKHFMLSIALSDGNIAPEEIKQIEKLYVALGLDKTDVMSDVHNYTASKKAHHRALVKSEEISSSTFSLDDSILAAHEQDTKDARSMLESIFVDDLDDAELTQPAPLVKVEEDGNATFAGLDEAHSALLDILLKKEVWDREEVHELCKQQGLMVDGAIETINDWSFDEVDAPLLDDDGEIYVDAEIVEEIKG